MEFGMAVGSYNLEYRASVFRKNITISLSIIYISESKLSGLHSGSILLRKFQSAAAETMHTDLFSDRYIGLYSSQQPLSYLMQHLYPAPIIPSRLSSVLVNQRIGIGLFVLLTLLYGIFFIRNFSGPLAEVLPGDTDQWEYMGYYLIKNLSFRPLPHLNLVSDQTFFPYGTNHAFQGWAFESNGWYALGYLLFGMGPWLNLYYLLSLLITSAGTYLLLRKDYGDTRAWMTGFIITFLNFYALNKYPGHFAYSIIHWTALSFITDFLLVRRVVLEEPVPLKLVLIKLLLLTLCFGLDLGYVMGYALSSFTLSTLFIAGLVSYRAFRRSDSALDLVHRTLTSWRVSWHPVYSTALLLASCCLALFYIPLLLDVLRQASVFTFPDPFSGGHGWMHPLRLLQPYFPGIHLADYAVHNSFHDMPEGYGAGSPGWLLLGLACLGFRYTPRAVRWAYLPMAVFFILHVIYHPVHIPSLQIFPWCRFNRHPSRVTLLYPAIAAILALYLPARLPAPVWISLLVVGLLEMGTVFQYRYNWEPYYFPATFKPYMNRVHQQPGEAILDWPFCVVGGNGVGGADGLCPLYSTTTMLYSYKRFHDKKTIGQYFGRLHERQIQPFIQAGWPTLLSHADVPNFINAKHLTTCFTQAEWQFFDRFYTLNDFAGINLCVDLIPKTCVQAFYARYGQPVATTVIPSTGTIAFIPKPARFRARVNKALGKLVRFSCGCDKKG